VSNTFFQRERKNFQWGVTSSAPALVTGLVMSGLVASISAHAAAFTTIAALAGNGSTALHASSTLCVHLLMPCTRQSIIFTFVIWLVRAVRFHPLYHFTGALAEPNFDRFTPSTGWLEGGNVTTKCIESEKHCREQLYSPNNRVLLCRKKRHSKVGFKK